MGAEGAKAADFHLAGLAGTPPAVLADADGFIVEVFFAAGHGGEIDTGSRSVNVPRKISPDFQDIEAPKRAWGGDWMAGKRSFG